MSKGASRSPEQRKRVGGRWLEQEPGSEGPPSHHGWTFGPEVGSPGFPESTHNLADNFCLASVSPSIHLDSGVEKIYPGKWDISH